MKLGQVPAGAPSWPPLLATAGIGSQSDAHAHHAMHLALAATGELTVSLEGKKHRAAGILTAPDVAHAIDARGAQVLLVFLDPESAAGAALHSTFSTPIRLLTPKERDALWAHPMDVMTKPGWADRAVAILGGAAQPERTIHPRVKELLKLVQNPEIDTSLEALAAQVNLSPGRLMHVFTESVGIALRPYLQWLKLQRAAAGITSGISLSEAAHAAGFADSAHMSRTFRQMFGVTPSSLRRR